jgi:hypothetical protein
MVSELCGVRAHRCLSSMVSKPLWCLGAMVSELYGSRRRKIAVGFRRGGEAKMTIYSGGASFTGHIRAPPSTSVLSVRQTEDTST